jgi:uncharacterized RDD family membrane protein YckC
LKTCAECGYPNDSSEHRCEKCGIRFAEAVLTPPALLPLPYTRAATADNPLDFPVVSGATAAAVALAPAWRGEVHQRVSRFRERKGSQGSLQFDAVAPAAESAPAGKVIRFPGPVATEQVEAPEPELPPALRAAPVAAAVAPPVAVWGPPPQRLAPPPPEPAAAPLQQAITFPRMPPLDQPAMLDFPVASVQLRTMAALLDGLVIAAGYALLFGACYFTGGRVPLDVSPRAFLGPVAGAIAILPILYLYLFLTYSESTPGMQWIGLRLVDFDGRPATLRQRRLRVWGSVASMASILLGYLWATVDDEHLTWHDRMSETCLTVKGS